MSRKATRQYRSWPDGASQNAIEYSNGGNLTGEAESILNSNRFVTFGPRDIFVQELVLQFRRFLQTFVKKSTLYKYKSFKGSPFLRMAHLPRLHWYYRHEAVLQHGRSLTHWRPRPGREWAKQRDRTKRWLTELEYER